MPAIQQKNTSFYQRLPDRLKDRSVDRYGNAMLTNPAKSIAQRKKKNKDWESNAVPKSRTQKKTSPGANSWSDHKGFDEQSVSLEKGQTFQTRLNNTKEPLMPEVPTRLRFRNIAPRAPSTARSTSRRPLPASAWQPEVSERTASAFGFDIKDPKQKLAEQNCIVCGATPDKWNSVEELIPTHTKKMIQLKKLSARIFRMHWASAIRRIKMRAICHWKLVFLAHRMGATNDVSEEQIMHILLRACALKWRKVKETSALMHWKRSMQAQKETEEG
jgi:hypothetical protein